MLWQVLQAIENDDGKLEGGREKKAQVDNFESQELSSGFSGAFDTVPEVCPGPGETGACCAVSEVFPGYCEAVFGGAECCPRACAGEIALNDHEDASHGAVSAWSSVEPGYQRRVRLHRRTRLPSVSPLAGSRQLRSGWVFGRRAKRRAGAEAGSVNFDGFVAAFDPCESPVMRSYCVSVILHERQSQYSQTHNMYIYTHSSLACSLHDVHVARCVQNSSNSSGDGVLGFNSLALVDWEGQASWASPPPPSCWC